MTTLGTERCSRFRSVTLHPIPFPSPLQVAALLRWLAVTLILSILPAGAAEDDKTAALNPALAKAASPYLRLHAGDKVIWSQWGDEAFARAKALDRPVFVSFGYTACHWCHVMQETHFNDPVIAAFINENFVPVVVDRERRPVLDETHMLVTEMLTRQGGWPNNVFLTPDRQPIYGIGYVPPENFMELMTAIRAAWTDDRPGLLAESSRMAAVLTDYLTRREQSREVTPDLLRQVSSALVSEFDEFAGGIGEAPKFFRQPILMFLLRRAERDGDAAALAAVERTLKAVRSGGIHDHLEGGFHRYAVDPGWRVPHFEKMLYDQAQMADAYSVAYRVTGNADYAATARKTLDYILADLTAPGGAFYATRDADSEGEEGTYYVWTEDQLRSVLGAELGRKAAAWFGEIADGDMAGKIILNKDQLPAEAARALPGLFARLAETRAGRQKPRRDDKIIASWNGLAIVAFARAAMVFDDQRYRDAAVKAADFLWHRLRAPDGSLRRIYFDGEASIEAQLEDHASLARAMLFVYDLTGTPKWLDRARILADAMVAKFGDPEIGDFYASKSAGGFSVVKPRSDGDMPSGNALALDVLARLARRDGDPDRRRATEMAVAALSGLAVNDSLGGVSILSAIDRHQNGEGGVVRHAGRGKARIRLRVGVGRLVARVTLAKGWHVNGAEPLQDYLIPTRLFLTKAGQPLVVPVDYPAAKVKKLAFNDTPVAVLEGTVDIAADISKFEGPVVDGQLRLQACSDTICLAPETLTFRLPVRP